MADIEHVGEYKFPTTDDANDTGTTLTFDKDAASVGSPQAGDVVVMYSVFRATTGTTSITTTGGQTWTEHFELSPDNVPFAVYSCVFNGTWTADPVITYSGSAAARLLWVTIWRNVDNTDRWDVDPTVVDPTTGGDQSFAFNTNTNGALAMLGGGQGDNNTGTVNNSFTAPAGSGNIYWRSSGGADFNIGHAVKLIPTAGAIGTTTFDWSANESIGYQWYGALKPDSGVVTLVIADAVHAHTADNLALTQHNVLAISDATHGHTVDNVILVPNLIVQDSSHGHTADNLVLTQHNVLAIQDTLHGHTAENLNLTQHNVLTIADALHGHTVENLLLTQHNVLAIQDALHGHSADNIVLTVNDGSALVIQDAHHGHTADALVLTEHNILVIADALHGHTVDNLNLTQHSILAIQDALHAHMADQCNVFVPGEAPAEGSRLIRMGRHGRKRRQTPD